MPGDDRFARLGTGRTGSGNWWEPVAIFETAAVIDRFPPVGDRSGVRVLPVPPLKCATPVGGDRRSLGDFHFAGSVDDVVWYASAGEAAGVGAVKGEQHGKAHMVDAPLKLARGHVDLADQRGHLAATELRSRPRQHERTQRPVVTLRKSSGHWRSSRCRRAAVRDAFSAVAALRVPVPSQRFYGHEEALSERLLAICRPVVASSTQ